MNHVPDVISKHADDDAPVTAPLRLGALAAFERYFDVEAFPQAMPKKANAPMPFRYLCFLAWASRGCPGSTGDDEFAGLIQWSNGLEHVDMKDHNPDDPTGPASAGE